MYPRIGLFGYKLAHDRDEFREDIGLDGDMLAHGGMGPVGVGGQDGVEHLAMFAEGFIDPGRVVQLIAAIGGQAGEQRVGHLVQHLVVAAGIDGFVEGMVDGVILVQAAGLAHLARGVVQALQGLALGPGHPPGGVAGAQTLDFAHHLEHLDHAVQVKRRHHRTLARLLDHQAGIDQLQDGLADRRARQIEARRQAFLVQFGAGAQLAREDVGLDGLADFISPCRRLSLLAHLFHPPRHGAPIHDAIVTGTIAILRTQKYRISYTDAGRVECDMLPLTDQTTGPRESGVGKWLKRPENGRWRFPKKETYVRFVHCTMTRNHAVRSDRGSGSVSRGGP
ncbi:hypothetical protein MTBLM5_80037 [Magnetospirillum sp. LM-5]|nr:hypothetical protein MTBLM5_80037 [Magnetospirillum sp. LM-5]